jgi:hypothetical protein
LVEIASRVSNFVSQIPVVSAIAMKNKSAQASFNREIRKATPWLPHLKNCQLIKLSRHRESMKLLVADGTDVSRSAANALFLEVS